MENIQNENLNSAALVNIITTAIKIPGIKVNRDLFLREQFQDASPELLQTIIADGPVDAKFSKSELRKMASKLLNTRTLISTGTSFLAGLPGGFAMTATIPADMIQFYAVTLKLAQEISYLYGECDLWAGEMPDNEKVTNQLILYCGVMLGAAGAAQTVRVLSSSLAKQAIKRLPQQALTKTFYYPIVKSIAKAFGAKMTKEVFAKGISKVVPLVGGVISGGITFATLRPMGTRLIDALQEAHFSYSDDDFKSDWNDIVEACVSEEDDIDIPETNKAPVSSVLEKIQEAKQMLDTGIISNEEFSEIKAKLIAQM